MFWCLAHRLELAVKDALKSTLFDDVDNILMHAYHIYKVTKKVQGVGRDVTSLKSVLMMVTCLTRVTNQSVLVALHSLITKLPP